MKTECAIALEQVFVSYNRQQVLYIDSLQIPRGRVTAIIGPNGAGKSTLLKSIMGMKRIDRGTITVYDKDHNPVEPNCYSMAYVPQHSSVNWDFPATIFDIVLMGCYQHIGIGKRPTQEDYEAVYGALETVGLQDLAKHQINELSGGQQQRAFIARALVQNADMYLLDEPLKGIDLQAEHVIMDVLQTMREAGKTIVVVHHALHTVPMYFEYVVCINHQLIAAGPVDRTFKKEIVERTFSVEGDRHGEFFDTLCR